MADLKVSTVPSRSSRKQPCRFLGARLCESQRLEVENSGRKVFGHRFPNTEFQVKASTTPVLHDEFDGIPEAVLGFFDRLALAIGPRNFRADGPKSSLWSFLDYRRKRTLHPSKVDWLSSASTRILTPE
jgi:hypothetical protein